MCPGSDKRSDKARSGRSNSGRGRPSAPEEERKDRVIQTRVPKDLESTLKEAAEQKRMTVSHLIRNVLEDTFNLVDGIVADSSALVEHVTRDAKRLAALAALDYLVPGEVLGVGTGSTVNYFIEALADHRDRIRGAVSSSNASTERLQALGIPVMDLNEVGSLSLYVDGADEADPQLCLIKGGGAALTREKIVAGASKTFVCIADGSKQVDVLGAFPLPVEVIPMARSLVARELIKLGGDPIWRQGVTTDNGNLILDVRGLRILDPKGLETTINQIPGVVTVGLFARRPADVLLLGTPDGVKTLRG